MLGSRARHVGCLVQQGVIVWLPLGHEQNIATMGRPRATQVYMVSKQASSVVVAQSSPEFTWHLPPPNGITMRQVTS
jgi:hypothetical protein